MQNEINRAAITRVILYISLILMAVCLLPLTGCSKVKAAADTQAVVQKPTTAQNTQTTKANSTTNPVTSTAVSTPKTTAKATTTTIPKMTEVNFTLTLDAGQNYTEYTTPIYLKNSQILHLTWVIVKGGDHFFMSFTRPSGELAAIHFDGNTTNLSPGTICKETLINSGDLVLRLDNSNAQEGYYVFHPQIHHGDATVTIKLLYWIEG